MQCVIVLKSTWLVTEDLRPRQYTERWARPASALYMSFSSSTAQNKLEALYRFWLFSNQILSKGPFGCRVPGCASAILNMVLSEHSSIFVLCELMRVRLGANSVFSPLAGLVYG